MFSFGSLVIAVINQVKLNYILKYRIAIFPSIKGEINEQVVGNTRCLSISGDTLKRTNNVLIFNWIFVKIVVGLKNYRQWLRSN